MTDNGFKDDYLALWEMARDKTVAGRAALASAVGDLFSDGNEVLTDRERALMSDILRRIVHEGEMPIRHELSEALADREHVPRELVLDLANDDIEVAYPILLQGGLLRDVDLIECIRHRTLQHQLAFAMGRGIGENVAEALGDTGEDDPIKTLLDSPNAHIARATRDYLVEQAKRVDSYQNPLLRLSDVDRETAKRIYWRVSAAVRQYVLERFDLDPTGLDTTLNRAVREIAARESHGAGKQPPAAALAEALAQAGQITPALVVNVLRRGEVPLFEALLAQQSGLRLRLLRRIIFEAGGEALAVVCRSIPMPKDDFAEIFGLTRKARMSEGAASPSELVRLKELYERIRPESAAAIVGRWQSHPDYLNAVRILADLGLDNRPAGRG